MKRFSLISILCLLMAAFFVKAEMDDVVYTLPVVGSLTNSATYVVRGTVESLYVNVTSGRTGTVTVADSLGATLFTKSITDDGRYYPRIAGQTTAGAAITVTEVITGSTTNTVTSPLYEKIAVAGPVTVTIVGAGSTTATNSAVVTLIVSK